MSIDPISLGIELALTAASMALTASQHFEGPRVQDLKATSADYGTPLTNFKGRRVFNCSVPWAEDLVDRERTSKSKGGKQTTHYATGTCMVHIADHAVDSIRRIWADEHLIWDRDASTQTFQFSDDYDLSEHLRFYLGTADQEPDPRMDAWTTAKYGANTCPAYRYQSYFIIEDVPLDLIGNRYPQWRVEAEAGRYQADIVSLSGGDDGHGSVTGYYFSFDSPDKGKTVFADGLERNTRFLTFDNVRGGQNATEKVISSLIPSLTYGTRPVIDNAGNVYFTDFAFGVASGTKTYKVTPAGVVSQLGTTNDIPASLDSYFRTEALFTVGGVDTLFYTNPSSSGFETGSIYTRPTSGGAATQHNSTTDTGIFIDTDLGALVQGDNGDVWYASATATTPTTTMHFWRISGSASATNFYTVTGMPSMAFADVDASPITAFNGKFYVGWGYNSPPETWLVKIDQTAFTVTASVNVTTELGLTPGSFDPSVYYGSGPVPIDTLRNQAVYTETGGDGDRRIHRIDLATMHLAAAPVDYWPPIISFQAWGDKPPSALTGALYPQYSVWHDPIGGMIAMPYDFHNYPSDFAFLYADTVHLRDIFTDLSLKGGLTSDEFDYSDLDQEVLGFSWTQGTPKQIAAYLLDVYDSDIVPHDFKLIGKKRTGVSLGSLATAEFIAGEDRYTLPHTNDRDLPRNIYFNFADYDADQNPNTAAPSARLTGATVSTREQSVDATSLAMTATEAKVSVDRYHRRTWFSRVAPEFGLTRQRLAIEPGDVWTPDFDGEPMISRATKTTIGANGQIKTEWALDDPVLAQTSGAEGAPADGHVPSVIFDPASTEAAVLDIPLLTDAHDQAAPFAYLTAGPGENKSWTGAVFSQSDTGEADSFVFAWDSIASSGGAVFGETTDTLPDALPWVFDHGAPLTVTIDSGTLTSATEDQVLNSGTVNLCAIKSGDGWELMQFTTPTLIAPLTYELTGRLRGVRGTEQYIAGHTNGDEFILLSAVKVHTLGASEIGDTDSYIASTAGQTPNTSAAFDVTFAANAHRPYSPVNGSIMVSGSDKLINATRRSRIGGSALDGMDVPLGEASEAWQADIYDGVTFKRTISGTSLPLTYLAADIATDAVSSLSVKLYQMDPTLNLRGFPLTITG